MHINGLNGNSMQGSVFMGGTSVRSLPSLELRSRFEFGPRHFEKGASDYWAYWDTNAQGHEIYVRYDDKSSKMHVETYYKGERERFFIDVENIDPTHASRVEMYALMVYKFGSGSNDAPHSSKLASKLALVNLIGSSANPLYSPDPSMEDPSAEFLTERLNYVELIKGLLKMPEEERSAFPDKALMEILQVLKELPLYSENEDEAEQEQMKNNEDYRSMVGAYSWRTGNRDFLA